MSISRVLGLALGLLSGLVVAPLSSITSPVAAGTNECTAGFGVHGAATVGGGPIAGATASVSIVAFRFTAMDYFVNSFHSESTTTAADGTFSFCNIDLSEFAEGTQISGGVVLSPPGDMFGPGNDQFGHTFHRFDLGEIGGFAEEPLSAEIELLPAVLTGTVRSSSGTTIANPEIQLHSNSTLHASSGSGGFSLRGDSNGWFGLASTSPSPVPSMGGPDGGEARCWGCGSYSVVAAADGHVSRTFQLGFFDEAPYGVWSDYAWATSPDGPSPEPSAEWSDLAITLNQSNLSVSVTDPSGDPISNASISGHLQQQCTDPTWVSCHAWGMTNAAGTAEVALMQDGPWQLQINPPMNSSWSRESFSVQVTSGEVSSISNSDGPICGGQAEEPCDGSLNVSLRPPNFSAIVRSSAGQAVGFAGVDIMRWEPQQFGGQWQHVGWANSSGTEEQWGGDSGATEGEILTTLGNGVYKLRISAPWTGDHDVVETSIFLQVSTSEDGTISTIGVCSQGRDGEWSEPDCTSPGDLAIEGVGDSSYYTLTMSAPNLRLQICASGTGDCVGASAYARLQRYIDFDWGGGHWSDVSSGSSNESGELSLLVAEEGDYRLILEDHSWGGEDQEARTPFDFSATFNEDGAIVVSGLGEASASTGRFELRFAEATLRGRVISPDTGEAQPHGHVEVFVYGSQDGCESCLQHIAWANTNQNAEFGLVLEPGSYLIRVNPGYEAEQQGLARTSIDVDVVDCDGTRKVVAAGGNCDSEVLSGADGVIEFSLAGVNFSGRLYVDADSMTPVEWSHGNVRVQSTDEWSGDTYWDWTDMWFNVRSGGHFGLAFTDTGRYRVDFEPPHGGSSTAVRATVELDVACTTSCSVTPTNPLSSDADGYIVFLGQPNVTGTLTLPISDNPPVPNSWINVEKWTDLHCREGCYSWDPSLDGVNANTRQNGAFGLQLSAGSYRLRFNEVEGYSRGELKIAVDAEGEACLQTFDSAGLPNLGIDCAGNQSPFSVTLGAPNYSGTVVGGVEPSRWSGIQFQVWNPEMEHWDWTNLWSNTTERGSFAVLLETAGFYKVTFEPNWEMSGYSAATRFLVVCESGSPTTEIRVKVVSTQTEGTEWECSDDASFASMTTELTEQSVSLVGANLNGRAEDGSGVGVGDVWIGLLDCGVDDGSTHSGCSWTRGVNTRRVWSNSAHEDNGTFGLSVLDNETSDTYATRYQLEVNPPWDNSQGFVRQRINLYAYSGWGDGSALCAEADYTARDESDPESLPTCSSLITSATPFTLAMTSGNISGRVITNDADCSSAVTQDVCIGVGNSWIEVQRWQMPEWDENAAWFHWQWSDAGANSNAGHSNEARRGEFSLNLTDDGLYRVTANPSWDNPNGLARRTVLIRVSGDNWCVEPGRGDSFDSADAEPIPSPCSPSVSSSDNASDLIDGLTLRLVGSNLLGRLYTPSTDLSDPTHIADSRRKVGDTWVGVERKVNHTWCDHRDEDNQLRDYCTSTWWEHIGGANPPGGGASIGNFAVSVTEAGSYRLRVNSPWNWSSPDDVNLTSFVETFTAVGVDDGDCGDGNENPSECRIIFDNPSIRLDGQRHLLKFPAPNVVGTLFTSDGARKVGGSWVSVYNETTNEWIEGSSTVWSGRRKGQYALLLETPMSDNDITTNDDYVYRLEFSPNWDRPTDGTRRVIRVTVSPDGTVTSPGFNGETQDVMLGGISLKGTIFYDVNSRATEMRYAWIEAERCIGPLSDPCSTTEWADSQGSDRSGRVQMGLENGRYELRVYPNWGLLATSPMELSVLISDGELEWCTYRQGGNCHEDVDEERLFRPNFHHVPPNVRVQVSGAVDDDRIISVQRCTTAECSASTTVGSYLAIYNATTQNAVLDLSLDFAGGDPFLVKVLTRDGENPLAPQTVSGADLDLSTPTASFIISSANP